MTSCWILTETGLRGTENQCIALAEAAGLSPEIKRIRLKQPWKTVTPWIKQFSPAALTQDSSELAAPWPDVLIASGRKAIAPALWVKRQSGGKTRLVIIQSPVIKSKEFDLVIVPQHDRYEGKNVLQITGALSLVTPEKLAAAKMEWASALSALPSPRIALLIGGTSRTHELTKEVADKLIADLQQLQQQGYSLMITASRRTPHTIQHKMRHSLQHPATFFWNGLGDNPYQGFLAWADAILVTEDSVSMASEAISTGKPVYIIKLEGGSARFKRFHDHLISQHYARWFEGKVESWGYTPPDDLKIAAHRLSFDNVSTNVILNEA